MMSENMLSSTTEAFMKEAFDLAKEMSARGVYSTVLCSSSQTTTRTLPKLDLVDSAGGTLERAKSPFATTAKFPPVKECPASRPQETKANPEVENLWRRLQEVFESTADSSLEKVGNRPLVSGRRAV